jgi:hypothetical protein
MKGEGKQRRGMVINNQDAKSADLVIDLVSKNLGRDHWSVLEQ